jgi:hypothetical protein
MLVYTSKIHMMLKGLLDSSHPDKIQAIRGLLWVNPIPHKIGKYSNISKSICDNLPVKHIHLLTDGICIRSKISIWKPGCEYIEDVHPFEHCFFISLHPGLYQSIQVDYGGSYTDLIQPIATDKFEYMNSMSRRHIVTNVSANPVVSYHLYIDESITTSEAYDHSNSQKIGSSQCFEHHSDPDLDWYGTRS